MHVCMYACKNACMYACMHVCMCACMHVWMYGCMDVCVYGCMDVWMYGGMDVWMYVCMYVCVCMFAGPEDRGCFGFGRLRRGRSFYFGGHSPDLHQGTGRGRGASRSQERKGNGHGSGCLSEHEAVRRGCKRTGTGCVPSKGGYSCKHKPVLLLQPKLHH